MSKYLIYDIKKMIYQGKSNFNIKSQKHSPILREKHLKKLGIELSPQIARMLKSAYDCQVESGEMLRSELIKIAIRNEI
jgi:hypothetical protein